MSYDTVQVHNAAENKHDPDFEYLGGSGLWQNWRNKRTGQASVQNHYPKVVKTWCKPENCRFILVDVAKRAIECTICGREGHLIVGLQKLDENGKLVSIKPPQT